MMVVKKRTDLCSYYGPKKVKAKQIVFMGGTNISIYYNEDKTRYIYYNASIKELRRNDLTLNSDPGCVILHLSRGRSLPRKYVERYIEDLISPYSYLGRIKIVVYTNGKTITRYEKTYEFDFLTESDKKLILKYLETERYNLIITYRNGKIRSVQKEKATI